MDFFKVRVFHVWSQTVKNKLMDCPIFAENIRAVLRSRKSEHFVAGINELDDHYIKGRKVAFPYFETDGRELLHTIDYLENKFKFPEYLVISKRLDPVKKEEKND